MGVFARIGGAIKRIGQRAGSLIKAGIKKAAPIIMNIAEKGTSLLKHIPGHIGTIAGIANKGINTVREITGAIPHDGARDAINRKLDKAQFLVHEGIQRGADLHQKATRFQPLITKAGDLAERAMRHVNPPPP